MRAGGVPAILRELSRDGNTLHLDRPTVTGGTLGESLAEAEIRDASVIYGLGLHSGGRTGMVIQPLPPDTGIHFITLPSGVDMVPLQPGQQIAAGQKRAQEAEAVRDNLEQRLSQAEEERGGARQEDPGEGDGPVLVYPALAFAVVGAGDRDALDSVDRGEHLGQLEAPSRERFALPDIDLPRKPAADPNHRHAQK